MSAVGEVPLNWLDEELSLQFVYWVDEWRLVPFPSETTDKVKLNKTKLKLEKCRVKNQCKPPAVVTHVAESSINHTGNELATGDEEGVDSDQLTSLLRGGNLSNIYGNCHRGNAWGGKNILMYTLHEISQSVNCQDKF